MANVIPTPQVKIGDIVDWSWMESTGRGTSKGTYATAEAPINLSKIFPKPGTEVKVNKILFTILGVTFKDKIVFRLKSIENYYYGGPDFIGMPVEFASEEEARKAHAAACRM